LQIAIFFNLFVDPGALMVGFSESGGELLALWPDT
jgi:hypothetical protein